jgi:hypothetical protein
MMKVQRTMRIQSLVQSGSNEKLGNKGNEKVKNRQHPKTGPSGFRMVIFQTLEYGFQMLKSAILFQKICPVFECFGLDWIVLLIFFAKTV